MCPIPSYATPVELPGAPFARRHINVFLWAFWKKKRQKEQTNIQTNKREREKRHHYHPFNNLACVSRTPLVFRSFLDFFPEKHTKKGQKFNFHVCQNLENCLEPYCFELNYHRSSARTINDHDRVNQIAHVLNVVVVCLRRYICQRMLVREVRGVQNRNRPFVSTNLLSTFVTTTITCRKRRPLSPLVNNHIVRSGWAWGCRLDLNKEDSRAMFCVACRAFVRYTGGCFGSHFCPAARLGRRCGGGCRRWRRPSGHVRLTLTTTPPPSLV